MKRKILLVALMVLALGCLMTISVTAAATNEFGAVETIDGINLTDMSSDTSARVVLFDGTEYHTYPANYIVKKNASLTLDFSRINNALGTSYSKKRVIRIEVPSTVTELSTALNGNGEGSNLVEIIFPEDSQVTTLVWGALMKSNYLESIHIPASVTKLGQDCFNNCAGLKSVTFAEGSKLTQIDKSCFGSCKQLTEIILPNSVTKIAESAFYNCTGIKKLVLGDGLNVFGGSLIGAYGYNDKTAFLEIYMPYGIVSGEGAIQSGTFLGRNNGGDLKSYVIYFTGTEAQAKALVTMFSADVNIRDANIVAFDPNKTQGTDYLGMDPYTTDITVNTNRVIVFGYNKCDAFYNGEHAEGVVINSCQFGCGRDCGVAELLDDPQHNLKRNDVFGEAGYFGVICLYESCSVCETVTIDEKIDPLFIWKGYSASTFGEGYSVVQGYYVNQAAIDDYLVYAPDFDYGVLATVNKTGDAIAPKVGDSGVLSGNFVKNANDYLDIKVTGIPKGHEDTYVVFCVYVTVGEKMYYLNNEETTESVKGNTYNEILNGGNK